LPLLFKYRVLQHWQLINWDWLN